LYQNRANVNKNNKNKIDLTSVQKEMDINLFTESPYKNDENAKNSL